MISLKDIESLTTFKRNTTEYVKKIKKSGNPLVLTVNGRAEIIVRDAESYQRILDLLDRAETIEAVGERLLRGRDTPTDVRKVSHPLDRRRRNGICAPRQTQRTGLFKAGR